PRVSTRNVVILAIGVSEDGGAWRTVTDTHPVPEWAWAGRTLFTFSAGATELALGGPSGRAVRIEVHLPYRGPGGITSVCAREQPAPGMRSPRFLPEPARSSAAGRGAAGVEPVVVGSAGDALGQETRGAIRVTRAKAGLEQRVVEDVPLGAAPAELHDARLEG